MTNKTISKNKKRRGGFTLIELLVVISIIALLSSVVLVAVKTARQKAQLSRVKSEMAEFVKALEIYRTAYGSYPSSPCNTFTTTTCYNNDIDTFVTSVMKTSKIYSGSIITTLKSIPSLSPAGSIDVYYASGTTLNDYFEAEIEAGTSPLSGVGGIISCNGKRPKEYLMTVTHTGPAIALNSSYWSKLYIGNVWDGYTYCAGN